jgi:predicted RNase H-like nuclease
MDSGGDEMSYCLGVDGAKSGWIAVWNAGEGLDFDVYASAAHVVGMHPKAEVIAVDIPMGLSDSGPRSPDVLARKFVGGRRSSSVFSSPVRGVLDSESREEASRRHREIDGRGFGAQAFGILPKIREWDSLLRMDDRARRIVREIHPEVCFAALGGNGGLAEPKKSAEGAARRAAILSRYFGQSSVNELLGRVPKSRAAADDVLDALAALWSAHRIARGIAESLPSPPEVDSEGQMRAIWY